MALVNQAQKIFDTGEAIPGKIRKAQEEELIIAGRKEQNRFDKFSNASKVVKNMGGIIEGLIDKEELKINPNHANNVIDQFRARNEIFDDALNTIGFSPGEVGMSVLQDGSLEGTFDFIATKDNKDQIIRKAEAIAKRKISPEELEEGSRITVFAGNPDLNQAPSFRILPPSKRTTEERLEEAKGKAQLKRDTERQIRFDKASETMADRFQERPAVKNALDLHTKFRDLQAKIDTARAGNAFIQPTVIKEFIRLVENRISNADYVLQTGNQSIPRAISRFFKLKTKGTFTQKDFDDIQEALEVMQAGNNRVLEEQQRRFSGSESKNKGFDRDQVLEKISSEIPNLLKGGSQTEVTTQSVRQNLSPEQQQVLEEIESSAGGTFSDDVIAELIKTGEL